MTVEEVKAFFRQACLNNRLASTYLVYGGTAAERWETGQYLASLLHCESKHDRPCGACSACRQVQRGAHPDVKRVLPEQKFLPVEEVRNLKEEISLTPYAGDRRLFILEIEAMKEEAANAMLKILEEPPASGIILILSQTVNYFLPTIVSRCQRIRLNFSLPAPDKRMEDSRRVFHDLLVSLRERKIEEFFRGVETFTSQHEREEIAWFLEDVVWMIRDALYRKKGLPSSLLIGLSSDAIPLPEDSVSLDAVETAIRVKNRIPENVNTRLALEFLFLTIATRPMETP